MALRAAGAPSPFFLRDPSGPCEYPFVYTLRCTGKLLKRLGPVTEATREPPTTVLGDWYGTLVYALGM